MNEIRNIPVSKIEPNRFNPNVMPDDKFNLLVDDMRQHGPNYAGLAIDPIKVAPKNVFYNDPNFDAETFVIIDGEHRWKAAKVLGWETIRCEVQNICEDLALVMNYLKNKERGQIDPWKEAALFQREKDRGLDHESIGRAFLVDRTTVTKRLSLLKITEETKEILGHVPHGTLTVSHFEPFASLTPEEQAAAARDVSSMINPSVNDCMRITANTRREFKDRERLQKAVERAKFKKCPRCGEAPERISYKELPWVNCASCHTWNLLTGRRVYEDGRLSPNDEKEGDEPKIPGTIRCAHSIPELAQVFTERFRDMIPLFQEFHNLRVSGKINGKVKNLELSVYGKSIAVHEYSGEGYSDGVWFRGEEHDYRTGEKSALQYGGNSTEAIEKTKKYIEDVFQSRKENVKKKE